MFSMNRNMEERNPVIDAMYTFGLIISKRGSGYGVGTKGPVVGWSSLRVKWKSFSVWFKGEWS